MQILQRRLTQMSQYSPKVHYSQLSHNLTLESVLNLQKKKSVCSSSFSVQHSSCGVTMVTQGSTLKHGLPIATFVRRDPPPRFIGVIMSVASLFSWLRASDDCSPQGGSHDFIVNATWTEPLQALCDLRFYLTSVSHPATSVTSKYRNVIRVCE